MKTLFAVNFDRDEVPHLCVADDEGHARDLTLQRAAEMEIPIRDQLSVNIEGTYPDFDDFEHRYSLRQNPYDPSAGLGGTLFAATGTEWETISKSPRATIWTLIESEDIWWISPGIHIVNRLGYLLTNEERTEAEPDYLYE
jgi:hypothetical protein